MTAYIVMLCQVALFFEVFNLKDMKTSLTAFKPKTLFNSSKTFAENGNNHKRKIFF
jgi:hypothetical protein